MPRTPISPPFPYTTLFRSKPVLLEPIYSIEVTVPGEYMGDVLGDISSRRGKVQGMDSKGSLSHQGARAACGAAPLRSEEHTSELQSRPHLVCRLLLEKKNT